MNTNITIALTPNRTYVDGSGIIPMVILRRSELPMVFPIVVSVSKSPSIAFPTLSGNALSPCTKKLDMKNSNGNLYNVSFLQFILESVCLGYYLLWLLCKKSRIRIYSRPLFRYMGSVIASFLVRDYRVGGGVTPSVLSHHRTNGSVYGGS
jgi:hypothetical protein